MPVDLHSMRVKELTDMCKKFGIKTGGRKAEIVERIQSHPAYLKSGTNGRASSSGSNKRGATCELGGSPRSTKKAKPQVKEIHDALNKLFDEFRDPEDADAITEDGIEALCARLGVDTQDPVVLVLSWFMEAEAMCVYTREEFVRGLEKLQCRSFDELRAKLPALRARLGRHEDFEAVYSYVFTYAKDPTQKSLALDMALALWELVLPGHFPLLPHWLRYVKVHCRNSVSKDLWLQVLQFGHHVREDLSNFDENGAWPVLLDDYVTHMKERIAAHGLAAVLKEGDDGDAVMDDA